MKWKGQTVSPGTIAYLRAHILPGKKEVTIMRLSRPVAGTGRAIYRFK